MKMIQDEFALSLRIAFIVLEYFWKESYKYKSII